ncbi:alpha/beta hydrolase [Marvinbryantia sp.]|uniref:alpha/beta hydrolase n=1 Tax=Marvinbryantia sp. TaxID=2496532 RepID=UPI0025D13C33|nr:alpha/beta hydrolase-fold protein [uncultured Marvinbryantia sp.]
MSLFSGEFTSVETKANVMVRILFPDSPYDLEPLDIRPKTMYLLHGGGGSSGDWMRFTRLEYLARLYNFTIVMADAGGFSFYSNMRYGGNVLKFFGEELPQEVEKRFRVPETTFICGQSMGGYGSLKVGLTYPERYHAIGCLSGAVNPEHIVKMSEDQQNTHINAVWGTPVVLKEEDNLRYLASEALKNGNNPPILGCCGTEDFLYEDNREFYRYLDEIGYQHEVFYKEGRHMWDFWDRYMPVIMEKMCKIV